MSQLGGPDPPLGWIGRIDGIGYKLGGEFLVSVQTKRVRIVVNNELRNVKISNIVGTIRGSVEPDRYVIVGNHRFV